ncbi:MAG: DUF4301 family protein [Smithellaceae bacterium]
MYKKMNLFSANDIRQIKALGLSRQDVDKQLNTYRRGSVFFDLNRPCTVKDGIISVTPAQKKKLIALYENEARKYKLLKFVPASGAASRMFVEWFSAGEDGSFGSPDRDRLFLQKLNKLAFFILIERNRQGKKFFDQKNIKNLLEFILLPDGLNFGQLPKALIPFHRYSSGETRTALEEHLGEAGRYIRSREGLSFVHFTVTAKYKAATAKHLKAVLKKYEKLFGVKYRITLSIQSPASNTIAVDENNLPLRDTKGRLLFRPGGHGALLKNLSSVNADFIFVKNIDNVVPEKHLEKILAYKKMLGGMALQTQKEIFAILKKMEKNELNLAQIQKIITYCSQKLNITLPLGFSQQSGKRKTQILFSLLNRPLRICGVVKNEGEPGGSPFWVKEKDSTQTPQIVEIGHVDKDKPEQQAIWSRAKYFNPVDMVCCIKNYRGEKFDLDNYVNPDAYLITSKNERGQSLKALEVPGLWNGGMAYWNTVFVELPLSVFNPVKTVDDLLRPEHLAVNKIKKTK